MAEFALVVKVCDVHVVNEAVVIVCNVVGKVTPPLVDNNTSNEKGEGEASSWI